MLSREDLEKMEYERLSPLATKAAQTEGRQVWEAPCSLRTAFQRDRDRIIHSKSFRRLMHKTQVFLAPEGDHFRTRLTHTLEVAQIARTCARALALNEDLAEAIALGHDLGHTPFGHNGEAFLDERHPGGFRHNLQSLRVVDVLDRNSKGRSMNLTAEVRDGIVNHTGEILPKTLEGQIVRFCDRIAYVNHDIDDALRGGIIQPEDLPADCLDYLGRDHGERIDRLVKDLVQHSDGMTVIGLSEAALSSMERLRSFMFDQVYSSPTVKRDSELNKIRHLLFTLYDYYLDRPDKLPLEQRAMMEKDGAEEVVKDHIAGMTDRYAINTFSELFLPGGWKKE